MKANFLTAVAVLALAGFCRPSYAQDNWSALASDRVAQRIGDSLTVVIFENSAATNTAENDSRRNTRLDGRVSAGGSFDESAGLNLDGGFEGRGQTSRSGRLVGQISVVVDDVLPNGDLHVAGEQMLNINGERTAIRLSGRVRRADISNGNAVISSRLADVSIDYDGAGFVSKSARQGLISRFQTWLGL